MPAPDLHLHCLDIVQREDAHGTYCPADCALTAAPGPVALGDEAGERRDHSYSQDSSARASAARWSRAGPGRAGPASADDLDIGDPELGLADRKTARDDSGCPGKLPSLSRTRGPARRGSSSARPDGRRCRRRRGPGRLARWFSTLARCFERDTIRSRAPPGFEPTMAWPDHGVVFLEIVDLDKTCPASTKSPRSADMANIAGPGEDRGRLAGTMAVKASDPWWRSGVMTPTSTSGAGA